MRRFSRDTVTIGSKTYRHVDRGYLHSSLEGEQSRNTPDIYTAMMLLSLTRCGCDFRRWRASTRDLKSPPAAAVAPQSSGSCSGHQSSTDHKVTNAARHQTSERRRTRGFPGSPHRSARKERKKEKRNRTGAWSSRGSSFSGLQ